MNPKKPCCPPPQISAGATGFVRGVIPQKLSDLENDLDFVTEEELEKLLNGGGSSDNPLLVNLSKGLNDEQIDQVKKNLKINDDFVAETLDYNSINWETGINGDVVKKEDYITFTSEGVEVGEGITITSVKFDINEVNKNITFKGNWGGSEQTSTLAWSRKDEEKGYRVNNLNNLYLWLAIDEGHSTLTLYLSDEMDTQKREEKGTFTK